jgi:DNA-binding beta-propeller fold protein YncE
MSQPSSPAGCIDDDRDRVGGDGADTCEHRTALLNPYRVAVSPDSANVYVSSLNVFPPDDLGFGPGPGELSQFNADLTQLTPPCLQQLGLPTGGFEPTTGCSLTSLGLILPSDVAFSPEGSSAYVSSMFHSVGSYVRGAGGALTQDPPTTGCSVDPRNLDSGTAILAQVCTPTVPLNAPTSVEVSPDGKNAYVTSGGFLTGDPTFGPAFADAGIVSDDAITVFGPLPAEPPPEEPEEPPHGECRGVEATIVATGGRTVGTSGDDVIAARKGRDKIFGKGGDDLICSGSGADRVSGGAGADRAFGGAGKDRLSGGADDDRLLGEGGKDRIRGGSGNDRLGGGPGRDRLAGGSGEDRCGRAKADRRRGCESDEGKAPARA